MIIAQIISYIGIKVNPDAVIRSVGNKGRSSRRQPSKVGQEWIDIQK